jgi:hypothetical protein
VLPRMHRQLCTLQQHLGTASKIDGCKRNQNANNSLFKTQKPA